MKFHRGDIVKIRDKYIKHAIRDARGHSDPVSTEKAYLSPQRVLDTVVEFTGEDDPSCPILLTESLVDGRSIDGFYAFRYELLPRKRNRER